MKVITIDELEKNLGYTFSNREFITEALYHSSFKSSANYTLSTSMDNERLEFLGDSLIGFLVSKKLFLLFQEKDEGWLSKHRSFLINEKNLSTLARGLELGRFVHMSKSALKQKLFDQPAILADAFEALMAAIFLDSQNLSLVEDIFWKLNKAPLKNNEFKVWFLEVFSSFKNDPKTTLQEMIQKRFHLTPKYTLTHSSVKEKREIFHVSIELEGTILNQASGKSKKEASFLAAKNCLNDLNQFNDIQPYLESRGVSL